MATRRDFIKNIGLGAAGAGLAATMPSWAFAETESKKLFFKIALSQFSLASDFWTKKLDALEDFLEKEKRKK